MYYFWTVLLGAIACLWVVQSLRMTLGMAKVPRLADAAPLPDERCPAVSLIFSARDEAAKLPDALPTQLAQDLPRYEVIAVDDRSRDATPQILDDFARRHDKLKVVHVRELPPGWLGKAHGLLTGYQHASGEWLVFTDADVRFAPDLVRRALALAEKRGWDHLTAFPRLEAVGFWEKSVVSYFVLSFVLAFEPWKVTDPSSSRYLGVGAFQLVRRSTYEAIGTHQRLAMEVADDTKLGKLVKEGGFRSGVARAELRVQVRWQIGLRNLVRGLTKNFFAACHYSLFSFAMKALQMIAFSLIPFLVLPFTSGAARVLAAVSAVVALFSQAWATRQLGISPLYSLTHPLGAAITCYVSFRSTLLTLWRGGVVWRETFYPLEELRRGMV